MTSQPRSEPGVECGFPTYGREPAGVTKGSGGGRRTGGSLIEGLVDWPRAGSLDGPGRLIDGC